MFERSTGLKGLIAIVLMLSFSTSIFAQSIAGLTGAELTEFNQYRLNISVADRFVGSVSDFGLVTGMTTTTWAPYQGFRPISEPDFFHIAGYPIEAELAQEHHQRSRNLRTMGTVFTLIGVGIVLSALLIREPTEPDDWNDTAAWDRWEREEDRYMGRVIGLVVGGTVVMGGGLAAMMSGANRGNWATAEQAVFVMDHHNQQLAERIRNR